MLEETVYVAALFKGLDDLPSQMHYACVLVPALLLGLTALKANRVLAAVGFATLHGLFYTALLKFTDGGYAYWLYSLVKPLHGTDWTGLVDPSLPEQFMLYGLPALVHGLVAPLLSLLIGMGLGAARKKG